MMISPLSSARVSLMAAAVLLAALVAGCKSDPAAPSTAISDTDAAGLFAAAYGAQSGGFLMQLGDALAVVHGGDFPSRADKKGRPTILRDTVVNRTRLVTTGGADYGISHLVRYSIAYTNNAFSNPRDYFFLGCKELKCVDTIYTGTMTLPKLTAVDSGWSQILMNNTDSTLYGLNGKFYRYGTYTFVGTSKTYKGKIETSLIPGAKVDPVTKQIVDGDVEIMMKGTQADGSIVEWAGLYVFRVGQPARIQLNGKTFIMDTEKGIVATQ
jgi:hypothetical protein